MRISKFILIVFTIMLVGCSGAPKYEVLPEWNKAELATIFLYRTNVSFHSLNPEKPFFYLDGKFLSTLGTGKSVVTQVLPGKHKITVKEPFMFMPAFENGEIEFEAKSNEKYYIRYSKDFTGIGVIGTTVATGSTTTLQFANEEYYSQKK